MIKEYQLTIPQNNFIITIPFKGCQVNAEFRNGNVVKGVFAKLCTNDPFMQRALENSEVYGKMYKLVGTVEEPGDHAIPAPAPKPAEKPAPKKTSKKADPKNAEAEQKPEEGAGKLSFDNAADAIMYIMNNYGKEVRSKGEALAFFAEQGITATING